MARVQPTLRTISGTPTTEILKKYVFEFLITALFVMVISRCSLPTHTYPNNTSDIYQECAISLAVSDFKKHRRLYSKHDVFEISKEISDSIIVVIIKVADWALIPSKFDKAGMYSRVFPSQYMIIGDKLFYWKDSTKVITQELLDLLDKHKLIDSTCMDQPHIIYSFNNDNEKGYVYIIDKKETRIVSKKRITGFY